jgi:hypothetical protein
VPAEIISIFLEDVVQAVALAASVCCTCRFEIISNFLDVDAGLWHGDLTTMANGLNI